MNNRVSSRIKADLTLFFVAIVWGSGFIAQRLVANKVGVFVFNGIRFLVGALCLLAIIGFRFTIKKIRSVGYYWLGYCYSPAVLCNKRASALLLRETPVSSPEHTW